jgi:hypothetical protein
MFFPEPPELDCPNTDGRHTIHGRPSLLLKKTSVKEDSAALPLVFPKV